MAAWCVSRGEHSPRCAHEEDPMSVVATSAVESERRPLDGPHVHVWELRAVEFDSWGQVSFYECTGCPGVRYA
jgi:hypothetical protein